MANHKSAEKRARIAERRTKVNLDRKNRIRTFIRKVEEALEGGDKTAATAALTAAQPEIARGVNKGVLKANTASRKISRLTLKVNALA